MHLHGPTLLHFHGWEKGWGMDKREQQHRLPRFPGCEQFPRFRASALPRFRAWACLAGMLGMPSRHASQAVGATRQAGRNESKRA